MAAYQSTKPPFTSYSSFFASGLLAANTPLRLRRSTVTSDFSNDSDSYSSSRSSPGVQDDCPSSPTTGGSSMDVDGSDFTSAQRRSATPTPHTQLQGNVTPMQSPQPAKAQAAQTHAPRLRRRRSSLTQAASPMAAIRSSTRAAGNALHLQKQLAAPSRARSGSLAGDAIYGGVSAGVMTMAMEATSLVGRMRSGSCSNAVVMAPNAAGSSTGSASAMTLRPRRTARRTHTAPVPAPRAPPPNVPLPALPPQQQLRPANVNLGLTTPTSPTFPSTNLKSGSPQNSTTSARARGMSVSGSTLSGEENRIDELKEN